jgi:hypothetical protein
VELVRTLEKAFEIEIAGAEAERILTVGQLYDLLLSKIPVDESARKCASAMAFYRLRRARKSLGYDLASIPSADLSFLERRGAKASFKALEQQTGLRLPQPDLSYLGAVGCAAVAVFFCIVLGFSAFFQLPYSSSVDAFALVVSIAIGWAIAHFDRGSLPKSCCTLGGLARKVAALNYGQLIKAGANHRDGEVW